jgi:hypothetical protein
VEVAACFVQFHDGAVQVGVGGGDDDVHRGLPPGATVLRGANVADGGAVVGEGVFMGVSGGIPVDWSHDGEMQ